jgi:hypothetical protein
MDYSSVWMNYRICITENHKEITTFDPVKFFWSIFSLYILLLSIAPCGDSDDCNVKKTKTEFSSNDHSTHNHDTESCSPFCHCACCGQTITFHPIFSTILKFERPLSIVKAVSIYDQHFISNYFASIWQPPQLS